MAFDFPNAPTVGQQYTPAGGPTYQWNGAAWTLATPLTVPDAPNDGSFYGRMSAAWVVGATKTYIDAADAAKVAGPAGATDNALARFDLATGKVIQNSGTILSDTNDLSGIVNFTMGGALSAGSITSGTITYADGTVNYRVALVSGGQVYTGTFTNHNVNVQVNNVVVGTWSAGNLNVAGTFNFQGTLQSSGGAILGTTGANNIWLRPSGAGSTTGQMVMAQGGNSTWSHDSQAKPTAGGFIASSDERIKTVVREYEAGLAAINALRPVVFVFKGNDTNHPPDEDPADALLHEDQRAAKPSIDLTTVPYPMSVHYQLAVDGIERIGMIAQEIEQVLPETITQRSAYIDGKPVDDLRDFDPTNIIYALVNAVKELSARIEALEAAR